ncbi:folate-binding protein [Candidatus Accumulibacter sp. ACC003]|uniref:CAF17-like 4Fe-4S cluster assembly/insertion protein YgfZ n=1 Tax=Candidatus Accumulibacter sp. ACC003 TaxID=2823334 RepID=UPI0025BD35E7|nr:folate-binding protein [Candidatus Accumulibacter sp. ACC003]
MNHHLVTDFGDAAAELTAAQAAHAATIVSPLSHLAVLEVSGSDAADFLHQQFTSDVKHLATDGAQYSAWCSAKGRMLASFLIVRNGPVYQLQLSADLLPAIAKRLQMFVLRSKVSISDQTAAREIIGLSGQHAAVALQAAGLPVPSGELSANAFAGGVVIRLDGTRFAIIVASDAAAALWEQLLVDARPVGTLVWQWLDIRAGVPLITERTKEEFVPQMANFEQLGAVSFHKGCYPGQEIIARAQYLGKVKRHLYRAHADAPMSAGDAIYSPASPQHPCGLVANAAPAPAGGYDALAIVQESFVSAADLTVAAPTGPRIDLELVSRQTSS